MKFDITTASINGLILDFKYSDSDSRLIFTFYETGVGSSIYYKEIIGAVTKRYYTSDADWIIKSVTLH
jgi:hypothetical protein